MAFDQRGAGAHAIAAVMQILGENGLAVDHLAICYDGHELEDPDGVTFGSHVWPGEPEHNGCHAGNLGTAIQGFIAIPSDGSVGLFLHYPSDASIWIEAVPDDRADEGVDEAE